ncbi:SpoIIE family protein phosphatase [Modestobacter sp. KNN46-3]|jgi:PAS domain S-box-containing protein|uniref:SpoIIE family protein phosphatase n=1 Tax=Modestobacter sp. KNN46-3 TaxID=2711218 RepID=UPI0013DF7BCC|nr:SpoIIE family protein phosphatase [Modestobacter sp. KNN46-3]
MSPLDPDRLTAARRVAATAVGSPGLQRLTDLAATLLRAPSAGVAVVGDVQTIAGVSGTPRRTIGSEDSLTNTLGGVTVAARAPLVVTDAPTDPRVADLPAVREGHVGSYLGVPLFDPARQHVVGVLSVFGPGPRSWSEGDVALLSQLAPQAASELELAALTTEFEVSRLRWGLAIDAAGIGSFDWDLTTGKLSWDDRLLELFGYERDDFTGTMEAFDARVHPDDAERVREALQTAIDVCAEFEVEYRVQLPSGETRWVQARGRALPDERDLAVRLLGAAYDTTEQRHGETRLARVLESMPAAFFSVDRNWTFSYVNGGAEELLGATREQLLGGNVWELFPASVGSEFEIHYRQAMTSGEPVAFDAWYPPPLDAWYEVRAWPTPEGLSVYFSEVTERYRTEQAARRRAEGLALVARVSDAVAAALVEGRGAWAAMQELTLGVVPALGDWVIVSLMEEGGRLHDVASWHRDPALRPMAARYAELRLAALTSTAPLVAALASGRVIEVPDVPEAVGRTLPPGPVRDAFDALAPATAVALGLTAHGRTVGAMSIYRSADRDPMDGEDVVVVQQLADRVALALDSAALHEQQRRMAEDLQRSLLTDPPQPDRAEIAVRYFPAVQAAQVGGDWYDAFLQPDGTTILAIGDVVGHDTKAAAAMGQLRGLLRGIAWRSAAGPMEVLRDLDGAIEGLQLRTLATAAVARLEWTGAELERGETRLRWSNAGHPPLLVRHADGKVEVLATERADLMLGVAPDAIRREHAVVLDAGATVLLYTDGLVEGRDLPLDDGVDRLAGLFAELGELPLGELVDQVVARLRPQGSEDDVALVAVRLHGGDVQRWPEGGPGTVPASLPLTD